MLTRIVLALVVAAVSAAPAFAQKEKKPELTSFPFWSAPKQPHAQQFVPGLQAALGLTAEQVEKIQAARAATIDSPEIRAIKKGDPNADKRTEATEKLFKEVDGVLTAEQKKLIEKINDGYARTAADVSNDFQQKLVDAKGDAEATDKLRKEKAEATVEAFNKKLDAILSAEQKQAVEKAAEVEKKRAAENANKPKPAKPNK